MHISVTSISVLQRMPRFTQRRAVLICRTTAETVFEVWFVPLMVLAFSFMS
jgi:hypothetical protein